jgi:hypothetical protein
MRLCGNEGRYIFLISSCRVLIEFMFQEASILVARGTSLHSQKLDFRLEKWLYLQTRLQTQWT